MVLSLLSFSNLVLVLVNRVFLCLTANNSHSKTTFDDEMVEVAADDDDGGGASVVLSLAFSEVLWAFFSFSLSAWSFLMCVLNF